MAGLSILTSTIGLILAGHGSEFGSYKETVEELAAIIRKRSPCMIVKSGFMELSSPSIRDALSSAVEEGAEKLIVVPVLLAGSRHTMQDIPRLLGMEKGQNRGTLSFDRGDVQVAYCKPIGADKRLAEIILDRVTEALKDFGLRTMPELSDAGAEIFEDSLKVVRRLLAKDFERMDPQIIPIVERVVHATADPEYARLLVFSKDAIAAGIEALRDGADVVTDVKMVGSGINARVIRGFGGRVRTYTEDERTIRLADRTKITRTAAAMQTAAEDGLDGDIVAIGNSPTAALAVADIVKRKVAKPALVIATPVGFVKAAESKDEVSILAVPYVITRGVKGGSAVAVAILNALLRMAR
ncbi:MAG TPA: precorrin-8X methylmutase [Candidatus Dormibacteraeota bacterium]|nr:precorrin-8X methylmutase [Candidatus Dormibacteraeota bacterium]